MVDINTVLACFLFLHNMDTATDNSGNLHKHYTELAGGTGWEGEFSLTENDSENYKKWLTTLKDHPDVVSYSLRPMYQLIADAAKKQGMKTAIEQYLEANSRRNFPTEPECRDSNSNLASNCCPKKTWRGTLEVTIIRAWNLYGDNFSTTDG